MTKAKRLVAILLAFIMAFSAVTVATAEGSEPNKLTVVSKFGRYNSDRSVWTEVEEVEKGDDVTLRVYLDSDFYSTAANLVFFYNTDFFTDSYSNNDKLTMGTAYNGAPYHYVADVTANTAILENLMVASNQITQDQANTYKPLQIKVSSNAATAAQYDGDTFIVEIDLKVLDTPSVNKGDFILIPGTVASTSNVDGKFLVNKGEEGAEVSACQDSYLWNLDLDNTNADDFVTLYTTPVEATLNANGGVFADGKDTMTLKGSAGNTMAEVPVPTKQGYNFLGWATTEDATEGEALTKFPDFSTDYFAVWESAAPEGETLAITTKFFRNVGTEAAPDWQETTRVKRGEQVKARIYLGSDYATDSGTVLFFYDNAFFSDSYDAEGELTLNENTDSFTGTYTVDGWFGTTLGNSRAVAEQINVGNLAEEYLEDNNYFVIGFAVDGNNVKLYDDAEGDASDNEVDNDYWFCEFDMTVAADAVDEADLHVVTATVASPSNIHGIINVPKGFEDTKENNGMWLWNANVVTAAQPVSVESSVTYKTDGGTLTVGDDTYTESYTVSDYIGATLTAVDDPVKTDYVFMGWYEEGDETQTVVTPAAEMPYEDTVYVAKWANEITLTFVNYVGDAQSFTGAEGSAFGETVTEPTKKGYKFIGWSNTDGGDSGVLPVVALPTVYPAADTSYYAVWEKGVYDANFYLVTAGKPDKLIVSMPLEYGAAIPTDFDKYLDIPAGYAVDGLYKDNTCTEKIASNATMADSTTNFYAKYVPAELTATFDANGGVFGDDETEKTVKAAYLAEFKAPADPTREGYTFNGWLRDNLLVTDFLMDSETGITYKADWVENTYTIEYYTEYTDDSKVLWDSFDDLYAGEEYDIPDDPQKLGFEFAGWDLDNDGEADDLTAEVIPMGEPVIVVVALWEPITTPIKVVWDANGGAFDGGSTTMTDAEEYDFGDTVTASTDEPTKADFDFVGWSASPDAEAADEALKVDDYVESAEEGSLVRTKTFYAVWKAITESTYTVETYTMDIYGEYSDTPDSTTTSEDSYPVGTEIDISKDVTADEGFHVDETKSVLTGEVAATGLVLKVYIARDTHTLTYMLDGEQYGEQEEYLFGASITPRNLPSATGYTFTSWDPAVPAVMGKDDVVVYSSTVVTATWVAGAGKWDDESVTTTTGTKGSAIEAPEDPDAPEGQTFAGWVTEDGTPVEDFGTYGENVTYVAIYGDIVYTLETYEMKADGSYADTPTSSNVKGSLTKDVDIAEDAAAAAKEGFHVDETNSVLSGTIGDDGLTLKVYYARDKHTVTYYVDGEKYGEADEYLFEAPITVRDLPVVDGYTFTSWEWTPAYSDVMGTDDLRADTSTVVTATWDAGDGKFGDESTTTTTGTKGSAIEAPEAPTEPAGKTFKGWTTQDGTPVEDFGNYGENVTYVAVYDDIIYTATWDAGEGSFPEGFDNTTNGKYGDAIEAPEDPKAPAGKEFKGWTTQDGTPVEDFGTFGDDVTYVAKYEDIIYTATWDAGEGSFPEGVDNTTNGKYGDAIVAPADPKAPAGKEFKGWTTEDGTPVDEFGTFGEDVTYVAKYEDIIYTATWDAGEGSFPEGVDNTTNGKLGDAIVAPADPTAPEGYRFVGWSDKEGGTAIALGNYSDNAEFFAVYEKIPYSAFFYLVSEGAAPKLLAEMPIEYDTVIPTNFEEFLDIPAGYQIDGWYKDADCTEKYPEGTKMPAKATNFYATMEEADLVATFDANGGQFEDGDTVKEVPAKYLAEFDAPADPVRDGYKFNGWHLNGVLVEDFLMDSETGNTYVADWEELTYTVKYFADDSTTPWQIYSDLKVGEELDIPDDPQQMGSEFAGWDMDGDNIADDLTTVTVPKGGLNIHALWTPITTPIKVVWDANGGAFADGSTTIDDSAEYYFNDSVTATEEVPVKDGFLFLGWAAAADATAADSQLKVNDYVESSDEGALARTKTFYAVFEEAGAAPLVYETWVRDTDENSDTYGQLISKEEYASFDDVKTGDALKTPDENPENEYYNFIGWDIDGDGKADTLPETAPAGGFTAVAVFERQPVYLIPMDGSTTVIDRGEGYYDRDFYTGKVRKNGTINEYSETKYDAWEEGTDNVWYVYGLTDRVSEQDIRDMFCDVAGDGYFTVTPAFVPSVSTTYNPIGTGSVIKVFDRVTGEQVEEFVIVIFGDVSGDADISATDIAALEDEATAQVWSGAADSAKLMASDINCSFIITATDISAEEDLVVWAIEMDQTTGMAS